MADLDRIIHQPVRLRIMSSLVALNTGEKVDFTYLRQLLQLIPIQKICARFQFANLIQAPTVRACWAINVYGN